MPLGRGAKVLSAWVCNLPHGILFRCQTRECMLYPFVRAGYISARRKTWWQVTKKLYNNRWEWCISRLTSRKKHTNNCTRLGSENNYCSIGIIFKITYLLWSERCILRKSSAAKCVLFEQVPSQESPLFATSATEWQPTWRSVVVIPPAAGSSLLIYSVFGSEMRINGMQDAFSDVSSTAYCIPSYVGFLAYRHYV